MKSPRTNRKPLPALSTLSELFEYNPETGSLTWRKNRGSNPVKGHAAGWVGSNGYAYVSVGGSKFLAHRIVWKMHYGHDPDGEVDHRDNAPINLRISNLRESTFGQNNANTRLKRTNKVGLKGVTKHPNGYRATIRPFDSKQVCLGYFDTAAEAHAAYVAAASRLHGTFGNDGRAGIPSTGEDAQSFIASLGIGARVRRDSTSGKRGVSQVRATGVFVAYATVAGVRRQLGRYRTFAEAAAARDAFDAGS